MLRKGIKIRREAVEQYTAAGRPDLAGRGTGPDHGARGVPSAGGRSGGDPGRGARRDRRRRQGHRQGDGPGDAAVQGTGRRQGDQPDRARGAAGRMTRQAESCLSRRGAGPRSGRHPVAVAGREQRPRRLETIELAAVLERVAAQRPARSAPRGCGRAGPPTTSPGSASELARVGEVAGALPPGRPAPGRADSRRRRARSPGSGSRAACSTARSSRRSIGRARRRAAGARRPPPRGRDGAAGRRSSARRFPTRRIERRLEQSLDPDGTCSTPRVPRLPPRGARCSRPAQRLLRRLEALLRGLEPARRRPTRP